MMYYMKDGNRIECQSTYEANVGQVLVLAHVSYSGMKDHPLAAYEQPSIFTVISTHSPHRYVLRDVTGREFETELGIGLHDAQAWAEWEKGKHAEDLRQKNARIQHLESLYQVLRGILVDQGVKVITPEQAKELGLSK